MTFGTPIFSFESVQGALLSTFRKVLGYLATVAAAWWAWLFIAAIHLYEQPGYAWARATLIRPVLNNAALSLLAGFAALFLLRYKTGAKLEGRRREKPAAGSGPARSSEHPSSTPLPIPTKDSS